MAGYSWIKPGRLVRLDGTRKFATWTYTSSDLSNYTGWMMNGTDLALVLQHHNPGITPTTLLVIKGKLAWIQSVYLKETQ